MIHAATGKIDINPSQPVEMGCGPISYPTMECHSNLEANALYLIEDVTNEKIVFVTIDALYVGSHLRSAIEKHFVDQLEPRQIFISASHTHYAPQLDQNKPKLGKANLEHLLFVESQIIFLISSLLAKELSPVKMEYANFRTAVSISRRMYRFMGGEGRRVKFRKIFMGPNTKELKTYSGHIARINSGGNIFAYIWQLPCHPVSHPIRGELNSHFPGEIRNMLREIEHASIPVLFLQGFSGDLRPNSVAIPKNILQKFRQIILGPWFSDFTVQGYERWINSIWAELSEALRITTEKAKPCDISGLHVKRSTVSLNKFAETFPERDQTLSVHVVEFSNLRFVGISAEVVAEYEIFLKNLYKSKSIIAVGCIDDTFGYAPTEQMILDGGYESEISLKNFEILRYRYDFEAKIKESLTKTIDSL